MCPLALQSVVDTAACVVGATSTAAARMIATSTTLAAVVDRLHPHQPELQQALSLFQIGNQLHQGYTQTSQLWTDVSTCLAGSTTSSEPAAQLARISSAPTAQDLQSATNPQLSTTQDPLPATDPNQPVTEFSVTDLPSYLETPSPEDVWMDIVHEAWNLAQAESDSPDLAELLLDAEEFLVKTHMLVLPMSLPQYRISLKLKQNTQWINKLWHV